MAEVDRRWRGTSQRPRRRVPKSLLVVCLRRPCWVISAGVLLLWLSSVVVVWLCPRYLCSWPRSEEEYQPVEATPPVHEQMHRQQPSLRALSSEPKQREPLLRHPGMTWKLENAAMVVLAYNRPEYLRQTLASLGKVKGIEHFTLYVSLDGSDQGVAQVIAEHPTFLKLNKERRDDGVSPTMHIAQHYRFVLEALFVERGHSHVIVAEDDMVFSPDFALFFEQLAVLLDRDPSLWCISSWNDNGFEHVARDPKRLFRTSYFPGLGWMMKSDLWVELREVWPDDHWDHWMRHSGVSRGRECVVPEVSRTYNIGELGSNLGRDQYARYFKRMKLNDDVVLFDSIDVLLRENYEKWVESLYARAEVVKSTRVQEGQQGRVFLLPYLRENFASITSLHLHSVPLAMWDTPRGTHNHSLILNYKNNTLILADRRHCGYLPMHLRTTRHDRLKILVSSPGEDCHGLCSREELRCHQADFEFINDCAYLRDRFTCHERGCEIAVGSVPPAYEPASEDASPGRCLVSEDFATCSAKHKGWRRLCPCIPSGTSLE